VVKFKEDAPDVFELPASMSIEEILKKTGRYPLYKFFVQAGGGASGAILNSSQLNVPVSGSGSISIYNLEKHNPMSLIAYWIGFFQNESCGKCAPCREGVYRIKEELKNEKIDWQIIGELLVNLRDSAFCGLGCAVPMPITGYFKNIFPLISLEKIPAEFLNEPAICECFKD
jgi:NADH:ubiquinone oxidoreductase subunit F (NADH-binding)